MYKQLIFQIGFSEHQMFFWHPFQQKKRKKKERKIVHLGYKELSNIKRVLQHLNYLNVCIVKSSYMCISWNYLNAQGTTKMLFLKFISTLQNLENISTENAQCPIHFRFVGKFIPFWLLADLKDKRTLDYENIMGNGQKLFFFNHISFKKFCGRLNN